MPEFLKMFLGWLREWWLTVGRRRVKPQQLDPAQVDPEEEFAKGQKKKWFGKGDRPPMVYRVDLKKYPLQKLNFTCAIQVLIRLGIGFLPTVLKKMLEEQKFDVAIKSFCEEKLGMDWQTVLTMEAQRELFCQAFAIIMEAEILHKQNPSVFKVMDKLYELIRTGNIAQAENAIDIMRKFLVLQEPDGITFPVWVEIKKGLDPKELLSQAANMDHYIQVRSAYKQIQQMYNGLITNIEANLADLSQLELEGDWAVAREGALSAYFQVKELVEKGTMAPNTGVEKLQELEEGIKGLFEEARKEFAQAAPNVMAEYMEALKELGIDPTELQNVSKDEAKAKVKGIFRKLALKNHPDRFATQGEEAVKRANEKFKKINTANTKVGEFIDMYV